MTVKLTLVKLGCKHIHRLGDLKNPGYDRCSDCDASLPVDSLGTSIVKAHSELSPSKGHRWLVCPGSLRVPNEDIESEWAAEGTAKHAALEMVLTGKPVLAGDIIELQKKDGTHRQYPVAKETIEQAFEVKEFIELWRTQHTAWSIETEVKVEIGSYVWNMPRGRCAGTCDVAAYSFTELVVLDAKFGWVQVEARDNPQLNLYALGLLAELAAFPIENVCLIIAQPDYSGEMVFREHRTTKERLIQWAFEQQGVIDEILAGSYRLQADDHACRYCPARTQCPARLKALEDFNSEEWIAAHKLEDLLPYVPRLEAICKDLKRKAMEELNAGHPVPGYKLVSSRSHRKWNDEAATVNAVLALGNVETTALYEKKLKSPAQLEKTLKPIMPRGEAKKLIEQLAFQPQGMPKLAREDDERPAIEPGTWTLEDVLTASIEEEGEKE